jgi:ABC-2 type transport system permease protein
MKIQRVKAVARKEFLHVIRDPRSLIMGLAIPMLLLFMFGYALTLDVDNVPFVVWDQSDTPASRELISRFSGSRYFSLQSHARDYREIEHAINRRDAIVALVVPVDFGRTLAAGRRATVQAIVDGSDSNTATIALGYAENIIRTYGRDVDLEQVRRLTGTIPRPPLDIRPRVWFNTEMISRNAIVPGLIAVIMMVIAAFLTSLTIAREWETGTMEQLISTPLTGSELITGKLVPYFGIGIIDLVLAILVGRFVFDVPLVGNLWLLLAMALVFLFGALSLGMLISIIGKNQFVSSQFAMMATLLPAFLLSGFVFPIANMPKFLQIMTHVIPARYFVTILRGIYLKGVGLNVLWKEAAFLAVFGGMVQFVAVRKFKKKIE